MCLKSQPKSHHYHRIFLKNFDECIARYQKSPPPKGNDAPAPSLPLKWPLYAEMQALMSSDNLNFQSYYIISN